MSLKVWYYISWLYNSCKISALAENNLLGINLL